MSAEMSQMSHDENLGNTRPDSSKRPKESKVFTFTWNNYDVTKLEKLNDTLSSLGRWLYGFEVGEEGTPHLQGWVGIPKKKTWASFVKCVGIPETHIEIAGGSEEQNIKYCSKDGNIKSNFYELPEPLFIINVLRPWQLELEKLLVGPCTNDRLIHWYWEPVGNVGKSAFCKYLIHKYKAIYIDEGKKSDLMNIIFNVKVINSKSIVCIDIPRDNGNKCSYKSLESIKTGTICNTKYETGSRIFNSPHVVVFSNLPPEEERMSADKWHIVEIV